MTTAPSGFLRSNAFLLAAVALPVVVAAFFLLASAIPQWTVPAPAYDLVLRAARPYAVNPPPQVAVEFAVRDGRIEAIVRAALPNTYPQPWVLFLFDHATGDVRELPVELPDVIPAGAEPRTIVVPGLEGRRVSAQATSPDGYELRSRATSGPGLVGELFGMNRYGQHIGLVNRGRTVTISLPAPYQDPYQSPAYAVGWVVTEGP